MRITRWILAVAFMASIGFAAGEKKQYATSSPDALYFILITNTTATSLSITNTEPQPWYLSRAVLMSASAITSTNTILHVVKHTAQTRTDTTVVTNEFGSIQTNYVWGIGADVNTYLTNTLAVWTNTASVSAGVTPAGDYIQRGDILRFTFKSGSKWLRLTGRR